MLPFKARDGQGANNLSERLNDGEARLIWHLTNLFGFIKLNTPHGHHL